MGIKEQVWEESTMGSGVWVGSAFLKIGPKYFNWGILSWTTTNWLWPVGQSWWRRPFRGSSTGRALRQAVTSVRSGRKTGTGFCGGGEKGGHRGEGLSLSALNFTCMLSRKQNWQINSDRIPLSKIKRNLRLRCSLKSYFPGPKSPQVSSQIETLLCAMGSSGFDLLSGSDPNSLQLRTSECLEMGPLRG